MLYHVMRPLSDHGVVDVDQRITPKLTPRNPLAGYVTLQGVPLYGCVDLIQLREPETEQGERHE